MDKTRTVGQKWLANELNFHFLTLNKSTKFQSNRSILSKVIVYTDRQTDRHTDTFAKPRFSGSGGVKTWTFDKNGVRPILHKSNTFSDENVKRVIYKLCEKNKRRG